MSTRISIDSHGKQIQAELFSPSGVANGSVVVIAHGSYGMKEPWGTMIRGYAADLQKKGFTVVIPNYLDKTGTEPGFGVLAQMPNNLRSWQEALGDAVRYAGTLPGISIARTGLLGFSLGGHLSLRLRVAAKAVVVYFAPELRELGGIGAVAAPVPHVQIHHGLADPIVPFSDTEAIQAILKREGTTAEVFSYEEAGHGFAGSDPHNATARRSSKERTLTVFEKYL